MGCAGSNSYSHFSKSKVLRIIPKYNCEINSNIIINKATFI
jgi:hypothetical protein